jgi:dienelactone hydrolase
LGCYFTDKPQENPSIEYYANAKKGSGAALLKALRKVGNKKKHPELSNAPLLLWGQSAGGEFNFEFASWKPERVIAFIVNKGGYYYTALAPLQARNVPGLFFTGENDLISRKDIVKGIFSMNRKAGAFWSFVQEPGAEHEVGNTRNLAVAFFDAIMPLRLQVSVKNKNKPFNIRGITAYSGYNGNNETFNIIPNIIGFNNDNPTSWLPTLKFANEWKKFIGCKLPE